MRRADVRTAATIVATLIGVGLVVGVLWWWVAPQPAYRVAEDGLYFVSDQPQEYVAADGWFAVLTGIVGLCAGIVVWSRCARAGLGAVAGLALGGLAGAAATAGVGLLLGRADPFAGALGTVVLGPLEIRAWGVLLVEAGLAVAVWLLLDLLVLRPEADPQPVILADDEPSDERPDYGAVRDL